MSAPIDQLPLHRELVLAYSCSHCESIRAPEIQRLTTEPSYVYETSSGFRLSFDILRHAWTGTAHGYVKLSTSCARSECQSPSLKEREEKLITAVKMSRMSFQNTIQKYLRYGVQYHSLPLALRVRTANQPFLTLLHHTYSIESRDWRHDPCLQPYAHLHDTLQRFEDRVEMGVWCEDYMSLAIHHLNTFRAIALELRPSIETLREGVKTLATLESDGDVAAFKSIVPGRKHHRKRFGKIEKTAVQKFVVEQDLMTKWMMRIGEMRELYTGHTRLPLFRMSIACPLID